MRWGHGLVARCFFTSFWSSVRAVVSILCATVWGVHGWNSVHQAAYVIVLAPLPPSSLEKCFCVVRYGGKAEALAQLCLCKLCLIGLEEIGRDDNFTSEQGVRHPDAQSHIIIPLV